MNRNINNYNEKEIKNKLKNFKEGSDYSVFREGEKKVFKFENSFLRDVFGNDYTTIYEVAESWDSDNFNYVRGQAEYENDKAHITYRYEHKINKSGDYYKEWSGSYQPKEWNEKHSWKLTGRPVHKFNDFNNDFFAPIDETENHRRNLEMFEAERELLEKNINSLERHSDYEAKQKIVKFQKRIDEINQKIRYHQDWLAKNGSVSNRPDWISCPVCDKTFNKNAKVWGVNHDVGFQPTCCYSCAENFEGKEGGKIIKSGSDEYFQRDPQQKGRAGRGKEGKNCNLDNKPAGCCNCGFKDINLSDTFCQKCGAELCDEAKKSAKSDLEKENSELKKQLAEVKNQLVKVLEELKKIRKNSAGQNSTELNQQIDYNEKLIRHGKEVPATEIKEQVQKSQDLLKKVNSSVVPTKDNSDSGALLYVIGGSVLVIVIAAIVGYYLWNRKGENKTS